jgi:hypothetical protein
VFLGGLAPTSHTSSLSDLRTRTTDAVVWSVTGDLLPDPIRAVEPTLSYRPAATTVLSGWRVAR